MCILTLDKRSFRVGSHILLRVVVVPVHRAEDVCVRIELSTLVLHRTSRIKSLHKIITLMEVRTVSSLVSKAPDDYRRMVAVSLDSSLDTLKMCVLIGRILSESSISIAHSV